MSRLRFVNLALAAGVVAFVVLRSHPAELRQALSDVDLELVALALLLNLPVLLLAPLRSSLIFRRLGYTVPGRVLIPTTIVGFVAGGLTPAASGELLRAGPLRTQAGVRFEQTTAAVLFERVLSLYLLALSTAVLFALTQLPLAGQALVVATGLALCLLPWAVARVVLPLLPDADGVEGGGWPRAAIRLGLRLAGQLRFLLGDLGLLLPWSGVTLAMFGVIALQYWLLARGVAGGINLNEAWLALGVSTLAAVASLIPLGLGVLDSSLAAVLNRLGLTLAQGEVAALLVRATVTLPLVIAAFACYLYLQRAGVREQPSRQPGVG